MGLGVRTIFVDSDGPANMTWQPHCRANTSMRVDNRASILGTLLMASVPAFGTTSTFTAGTEGWSAMGDVQGSLTWSATGGNPTGYVFIDDLTTGGVTYFVAPSSFLGDVRGAYGTSLTFDLRQVYPGAPNQFNDEDVLLQGAGLTLAYDLTTNPANGSWTSYSVPLLAAGWRVGSLSGPIATADQLQSVLSNLTALRVRAEYQSGADVGSLDNVSMVPEPGALTLFAAGGALMLLRGVRRGRSAVGQ